MSDERTTHLSAPGFSGPRPPGRVPLRNYEALRLLMECRRVRLEHWPQDAYWCASYFTANIAMVIDQHGETVERSDALRQLLVERGWETFDGGTVHQLNHGALHALMLGGRVRNYHWPEGEYWRYDGRGWLLDENGKQIEGSGAYQRLLVRHGWEVELPPCIDAVLNGHAPASTPGTWAWCCDVLTSGGKVRNPNLPSSVSLSLDPNGNLMAEISVIYGRYGSPYIVSATDMKRTDWEEVAAP